MTGSRPPLPRRPLWAQRGRPSAAGVPLAPARGCGPGHARNLGARAVGPLLAPGAAAVLPAPRGGRVSGASGRFPATGAVLPRGRTAIAGGGPVAACDRRHACRARIGRAGGDRVQPGTPVAAWARVVPGQCPDPDVQAERGREDPLQVRVASAGREALDVTVPREPQGKDAVVEGNDGRVAQQHPRDPALALDGIEDRVPVAADHFAGRSPGGGPCVPRRTCGPRTRRGGRFPLRGGRGGRGGFRCGGRRTGYGAIVRRTGPGRRT